MEHRACDDLAEVAKVYGTAWPGKSMSKEARLRRWRDLLRSEPNRILQTLFETEWQTIQARDAMRCDNSAITVAFEDPVLRAEGLAGDSYGDARRFFGLTNSQLHFALCYCYSGPAMSAGTAARRLERCIPQARPPGLLRRMLTALAG